MSYSLRAYARHRGVSFESVRRAVQSAFGNAKVAGRNELAPEDVDLPRNGRKSRIGF